MHIRCVDESHAPIVWKPFLSFIPVNDFMITNSYCVAKPHSARVSDDAGDVCEDDDDASTHCHLQCLTSYRMRLRPELTPLPVVMKQLSSCFGFLSKKVELSSSIGNVYATGMSQPEVLTKREVCRLEELD